MEERGELLESGIFDGMLGCSTYNVLHDIL